MGGTDIHPFLLHFFWVCGESSHCGTAFGGYLGDCHCVAVLLVGNCRCF